MLSGDETTRLSVYGGIGTPYGSFASKVSGSVITRLAIYGGIGIPYGSFSGKTASTVTVHDFNGRIRTRELMRRKRLEQDDEDIMKIIALALPEILKEYQ